MPPLMKNSNIVPVVIIILVLVGIYLMVQSTKMTPAQNNTTTSQTSNTGGLVVTDEVVGTGAEAKAGMTVTVQYTGTLENGKKFDSSYDHGTPFTFALGAGQVIKGWDQGVAGMKVGGKRKLVIPPALGYGAQDVGGGLIPPNSTLTFEVELVSVK